MIDLGPLAARAILAAHEPVIRSVLRAQAISERLIEARGLGGGGRVRPAVASEI